MTFVSQELVLHVLVSADLELSLAAVAALHFFVVCTWRIVVAICLAIYHRVRIAISLAPVGVLVHPLPLLSMLAAVCVNLPADSEEYLLDVFVQFLGRTWIQVRI